MKASKNFLERINLNFIEKMKIKFYLLILLFIPTISIAQKEAAVWYFGEKAGLDFNSGSPVSITDGKIVTNEGCASISDKNGNILFYTDGTLVYNKLHQIMWICK